MSDYQKFLKSCPRFVVRAAQLVAGWAWLFSVQVAHGQVEVVQWGHQIGSAVPTIEGTIEEVVAGRSFGVARLASGRAVGWGRVPGAAWIVPPGEESWTQLAAGSEHALGRRSDGSVVAWGRNQSGQCNVPADLGSAAWIAAGTSHSLAIRSDGTVRCWGRNVEGQCSPPSSLLPATQADGGATVSAAVLASGVLVLWGSMSGEFNIPGGASMVQCMAGSAICLSSTGAVFCVSTTGMEECLAAGGSHVTTVAAGLTHWAVLRSDQSLAAFGSNSVGQTAIPTDARSVRLLATGDYSTVLVDDMDTISWRGSLAPVPLSSQVGDADVERVSMSDHLGVAMRSDGSTEFWGTDPLGIGLAPEPDGPWIDVAMMDDAVARLRGSADLVEFYPPQQQPICEAVDGQTVRRLISAEKHLLWIGANGGLTCCVTDAFNGDIAPCLISASDIADVAIGTTHVVLLSNSGQVTCAGWSNYGQCVVPVELSGAIDIAAGSYHSAALTPSGVPVVWGDNSFGQRLVPGGLNSVIDIAAGRHHTIALKSNGEVVAWGSNSLGQCNVPAFEGRVIAVDAGPMTSIAYVASTSSCPADLNQDGVVDGADLGQLLTSWGSAGRADLNGDGVTDGADLGALLTQWGACQR